LQRLKPGSPERQAAANTIRSLRAQKDEAEKLTDAQIAQMMSDEAAARTRQQAETATAVARTRAAAFPGWGWAVEALPNLRWNRPGRRR